MIVYPKNWRQLGRAITLDDIDSCLMEIMREIDCISLSYSGGIDSSLLLDYILKLKGAAECFTIANDKAHPDIYYSQLGISHYREKYGVSIPHNVSIRSHLEGDDLVKCFYTNLSFYCKDIIAGDGIDELACGYYAHQSNPDEQTYFDYLKKMQAEQLEPLNLNSGNVQVHLPFCDDRLVSLLYKIPLSEKVNSLNRKMIICCLAEGKVPEEIIERRKYGLGTSVVGEGVAL